MTSDRQKDKTMYNKTIYAILFLSAAFCLRAAGQEAPQKNMYDFGFIKDSNPWLSSFNAAGLGTLQVERTSFAEASFDKEDGGVIPVEGSDDSWQAGAQTESFVKISDRIAFHGKLSYSYFSGRNMGGHYLMDPGYNPINFVESTEEDRGTKVKELYGLLGGISYTFNEKWAIGANVKYETGDYAKRKDPRPRSRWLDLDITAGAKYSPVENFSVGLDLQYRRTIETLDGDIFGTTDRQYYTLIDYGGYFGYTEAFDGTNGYVNVGSSTARNARPMANTFYGGSLQLAFGRSSNILFFNELTYLRREGRYGNRASTHVTYSEHEGNIFEYSGALNINRGASLHRVTLNARYEYLLNYENIWRRTTNPGEETITEYFGQTETLDRSKFNGSISYTGYLGIRQHRPEWEFGASFDASYLAARYTYYPFWRVQYITSLQGILHGKKNFVCGNNIFTVGLAAAYLTGFGTKNLDGSYATTSSDNLVSGDSYLNRDFEYDTISRMSGTLGFRYTRLFGHRIAAYIDIRDTWCHTLEKPVFLPDGYRNVFTVTLGCSF